METWESCEEFYDYAVSNTGLIMKIENQRVVPARLNHQGFLMVNLMDDRRQFTRSVAMLVAKAFLEPPRNRHYNSVIHLNGDRTDCHADNLMWRPRWYAMKYHKMFEDDPYRVSVYIADTDESFETLREACMKYGLIEKYTYLDMCNDDPVFHYSWNFKPL